VSLSRFEPSTPSSTGLRPLPLDQPIRYGGDCDDYDGFDEGSGDTDDVRRVHFLFP
jgi:hypothetical protein